MQRILITGAGGFIGSHLIEYFAKKKDEFIVRVTDLQNVDLKAAKELNCEIYYSDLLDKESLKKVIQDVDIIIHTAAIFNFSAPKELLQKVNVEGTKNICEVAKDTNISCFIMFSTVGVYGKPKKLPATEDIECRPRNNYEKTKYEAEKVALSYYKDYNLPVIVIRPALVYGKYSKYGDALYLCLFSGLAARGKKLRFFINGGPKISHLHIEDLLEAIYFLINKKEEAIGNIYNIAEDEVLSFSEYIKVLLNYFNVKYSISVRYIPWLWRIVVTAMIRLTPPYVLKFVDWRFKKKWSSVVKDFNLKYELQPRPEKGWLDYVTGDHYYSNEKIKKLGFSFKHKFSQSSHEIIKWYQENKWIP